MAKTHKFPPSVLNSSAPRVVFIWNPENSGFPDFFPDFRDFPSFSKFRKTGKKSGNPEKNPEIRNFRVKFRISGIAHENHSGHNFYLKTEGQKWHVSFCLIFLTCCWETCWGNIFCSSNYWKGQQPRGHSKLNVLSKPSMSIPSSPKVHTKYLRHSCCQLTTFWPHWAIFEFTAVYDAKRNWTEEVNKMCS